MKITVDIDCTPQELRTFLGLPDVQPMQTAVLDEMQRRMMDSIDQVSPTAVMKDWLGPMSAVQQAFMGAMSQAAAGSAGAGTRASSRSRRKTEKPESDDDSA
ncbi:hypothetical protein BJY21_001296 [Kineosphaera limosa]|uniref:Uncharacterized protein n=1 Tax=Kineosphaera limosa NBRC 100340 TaxID=1184609 RepID=K6WZF9_9MICO|nr:DUF6489 family protein [Kineosphaera limosa]NYE00112.1 hypothetical protein [Kineosphaera limosa]GAB97507.1 hypothetical protein KILIM_072_00160 [Kineosphaera limosa NBRC 100340]